MKHKHQKTLESIFSHPVGNIAWRDIEALLAELDAEVCEREGSRVLVRLFGERRVRKMGSKDGKRWDQALHLTTFTLFSVCFTARLTVA